jgi:hypothetical protein
VRGWGAPWRHPRLWSGELAPGQNLGGHGGLGGTCGSFISFWVREEEMNGTWYVCVCGGGDAQKLRTMTSFQREACVAEPSVAEMASEMKAGVL